MRAIGRRQGGAGFATMMMWLVVVIVTLTLGFKLGPSYVEFNTVKLQMKAVAKDPGMAGKSRPELMSALNKRLDLNSVRGLPSGAVTVDQTGPDRALVAAYEVRTPLFFNISALLSFDHREPLPRP